MSAEPAVAPIDEPRSLDEIVECACNGEADAFNDIYRRFKPEIVRFMFYNTGDAAGAEDLTQQVFVNVWRSLPRYRHRGRFRAWLYRVARNQLTDHYRARRSTLGLDSIEVAASSEPEADLVTDELRTCLRRALARLPAHYREVLVMRFLMNRRAAEVGADMDRTADAVRSLQVRALGALREEFRSMGLLDETSA